MATIYGKFEERVGLGCLNTETAYIMGVDSQRVIVERRGQIKHMEHITNNVEWCEELKGRTIDTVEDLRFEIENIKNRKENPNLIKAKFFVHGESNSYYKCLVDKNFIETGNWFIKCIKGDVVFYLNTSHIKEIIILDNLGEK